MSKQTAVFFSLDVNTYTLKYLKRFRCGLESRGGKNVAKIYIYFTIFLLFFCVFFVLFFCTNLYKILKCVNFFSSSYNTSSCTDIILCKDPETALRMDVAVSTAECSGGCKKNGSEWS